MLTSILIAFFNGFLDWLKELTLFKFILIFWPLVLIDLVRTLAKSIILLTHAAYSKLSKKEEFTSFYPKISLIIPAHNEEKIIVRAIESALEADYPKKEIIVVDDGSTDRTFYLAHPYAKKGLIKLVRRSVASGSKAGALNHGLFFATGDIIVTVDADTILERNALKEIVKPLANPKYSAVSGNVRVLMGERGGQNILVKLQAYEYLLALELGRRFNALVGTLLIISGAFGAFWKKHVESLGHYDKDTITEDFDISVKVRKLKKRLAFAEKAIAWTFVPENWKDWRRQRIRWTRGQIETLWKHKNLFLKETFDLRFVLAVYDMLFMDIILLFIRFSWFFGIGILYLQKFLYILILSLLIYLFMELFLIVTAGLLSPRKQDLKKAYLVPIVVLFYRPLYALIRSEAYLKWLLGKEAKW